MAQYVSEISSEPQVQGWLSTLNGYASGSIAAASSLASSLGAFTGTMYIPSYNPPVIRSSGIGIGGISTPNIPAVNVSTSSHPGTVAITTPGFKPINAPLFDVTKLVLNIPVLPTVVDPTAPIKPNIDLDIPFPSAPNTTLPDDPVMIDIVIPDVPIINLPTFDTVVPIIDIVVPGITFSFNEDIFSDDLLTKVKDELLIRLSGGTGLEPVVEAAIWNRGRDREHVASQQTANALLNEKTQTGFTRPNGAVLSELRIINQDSQNKIIDLSREIMIKQADLEQENIKHSIQQTIVLEDILMREHNNINNRAFEVAKYLQNIAIEIYKQSIVQYNLKLEAYKAEAIVFDTVIKGELAKVQIFKTEVEAQGLISEINSQSIAIYNAQIEAIKTTVEVYAVEVKAISEQLRAESIKIDAFKAEVDAYTAEISANTEKYRAYSEQVKAEGIKADIYKTEVDAYASKVQAYATENSALISEAQLELETQSLIIKQYLANLEGYLKEVQTEQLYYQNQIDIYKGEASMYSSKVSLNTAKAEVAIKDFESQVFQSQYASTAALEGMKLTASTIDNTNKGMIEGLKAAGSVHAQIASSALNAINVSASNGSSLTNSLSEKYELSGVI